jgi:hypothetical protein
MLQLDLMVAPLRDLLDREIFIDSEIRSIVARRRESEYLLRRRAARKADFLRYIEAEQALEKLRLLRTVKRKREEKRRKRQNNQEEEEDDESNTVKKKQEQHIGDAHIIQHIHMLFVRALRKFRADLSLHLLHADFCKEQKSFKRLGRVYAEALQVFPRQAGLWIEAASQEFFGPTRSIRSARILLQRALRINGTTSQELWLEYFSLELHYAQTLKGRRQILLGETSSGGGATAAAAGDDYTIAMIVYKNAVQAIPDSVPFRLRFLDNCQRFPGTGSITSTIQSSLEKEFQSSSEAWIARALYAAEKQKQDASAENSPLTQMEQQAAKADDNVGSDEDANDDAARKEGHNDRPTKKSRKDNIEPVVAVLEHAVKAIPTDEMYLQALRFAKSYENQLEDSPDVPNEQLDQVSNLVTRLLQEHGGTSNQCSVEFVLEHADYLFGRKQRKEAAKVLEDYCNKKKVTTTTKTASVWIKWAGLVKHGQAVAVLRQAVDRIPISDKEHMIVLLQLFGSLLASPEKSDKEISDVFQRILLLAPGTTASTVSAVVEEIEELPFGLESVSDAYLQYLEYAIQNDGLKGARKMYTPVVFHSTQSLGSVGSMGSLRAFLDKCLELEAEAKDKKCLRRLYDKAIDLFQDTPLEDFYRHERAEKTHF